MRHHRATTTLFGGAVAVASLVAIGGGASAATLYGQSTTGSASPMSASKPMARALSAVGTTTLHVTKTTVDGKNEAILVNAQGLPLYYFPADTAKKSSVSGELAHLWPPLVSTSPTATGTRGKVTVLKDAFGHQVAFNGHLLYTFIEDAPGHVTGQGVSNFLVATPTLKAIGSSSGVKTPGITSGGGGSSTVAKTTPGITSRGGYGY
jgi:predicted lipoprotein with Yx(FWY)xxD motif